MGKVNSQKKASAAASETAEIARFAAVASAKQQFINSTIDMGWRLALTVLVPIILGTWLDQRYDTSRLWTFLAIIVAAVGAVLVVNNTLSNINKHQSGGESK